MKTTMRRYQRDDDYWRIRTFLRDVLLINNRDQVSWEVARFDYWRWLWSIAGKSRLIRNIRMPSYRDIPNSDPLHLSRCSIWICSEPHFMYIWDCGRWRWIRRIRIPRIAPNGTHGGWIMV